MPVAKSKALSLKIRGYLLACAVLLLVIGGWHLATLPKKVYAPTDPAKLEYSVLMGDIPEGTPLGGVVAQQASEFVSPQKFADIAVYHLSDPFYDKGINDKGIGIQLGFSIVRVLLGFILAMMVAIPLGYLIGISPILRQAFMPFVQLLKPISPLAWMPIALYTIKDANASSVFVIFICSIWPMLTLSLIHI